MSGYRESDVAQMAAAIVEHIQDMPGDNYMKAAAAHVAAETFSQSATTQVLLAAIAHSLEPLKGG